MTQRTYRIGNKRYSGIDLMALNHETLFETLYSTNDKVFALIPAGGRQYELLGRKLVPGLIAGNPLVTDHGTLTYLIATSDVDPYDPAHWPFGLTPVGHVLLGTVAANGTTWEAINGDERHRIDTSPLASTILGLIRDIDPDEYIDQILCGLSLAGETALPHAPRVGGRAVDRAVWLGPAVISPNAALDNANASCQDDQVLIWSVAIERLASTYWDLDSPTNQQSAYSALRTAGMSAEAAHLATQLLVV